MICFGWPKSFSEYFLRPLLLRAFLTAPPQSSVESGSSHPIGSNEVSLKTMVAANMASLRHRPDGQDDRVKAFWRRAAALFTALSYATASAQLAAYAQDVSLQSSQASRDRPLFSPTRRPIARHQAPTQKAPDVGAVQPQRPNFELRGIVYGQYHRVAIIKNYQDGQSAEIAVGGDIDGWTVAEIEPRRIALRRDALNYTLQLPEPGH
jgi:hypothetical protein